METKSNFENALKPSWAETWILGGGPSAANFDLGRLRGKVIAVNDSVFKFSLPSEPSETGVKGNGEAISAGRLPCIFSLDHRWVRKNKEFLNRYPGEKYIALPLETWPDCDGVLGAEYFDWSSLDGLSDNFLYINTGCHSGYGAIGLAVHMGAREIHLVGYDLDPSTDIHHPRYVYWAKNYDTMVPRLKQLGIKVFNHNINSFVTAFPRVEVFYDVLG